MAQGLQVWDASGVLVLDVTERLTRHVVSGSYQPPAGSGVQTVFVAVPGMANDGTWIVVASSGPGSGNPVTVVNGGFNVVCNDSFGTTPQVNYYTVLRV